MGFRLLLNESALLERGSARLRVAGVKVFDPHHGFDDADLAAALGPGPDPDCTVLLAHNPQLWDAVLRHPGAPALTLTGHTHGGHMEFAVGSWSWSPAQWIYPRWGGLYAEDGRFLYVNRGLGGYGLNYRIGRLPEVTVFTLHAP
jgi:hypothetical protein